MMRSVVTLINGYVMLCYVHSVTTQSTLGRLAICASSGGAAVPSSTASPQGEKHFSWTVSTGSE